MILVPAEDGETIFLTTPADDVVQDALNNFIFDHAEEIAAKLPEGASLEDVLVPVWQRAVRPDEIRFSGTVEQQRSAAADVILAVHRRIESTP